ncbi:MAG: hypothetical protein DMG81_07040 [Acidobacteria bacterium]|nr:MAG: hypothetical protein DMG81_07040 [Acidobacteriota bacterium]
MGKRGVVDLEVNELKTKITVVVEATLERLQGGASADRLLAERVDITLPGIRRPLGTEHPVIRTMNEIVGVFRNLGYSRRVREERDDKLFFANFAASLRGLRG